MSNFVETFTVTAPTRVDLAGGTLDIWPLYCLFSGAKTINVAINLEATGLFRTEPHTSFKLFVECGEGSVEINKPLSDDELNKLSPSVKFPAFVISEYLKGKK